MFIKGFQEITMTDWPGVISSIIFTGGCNLRCFYCHNFALAFHPENLEDISPEFIFEILKSKKDWIDGVVISGGEPTIHGTALINLITKVKKAGFKVKLFTNGTNPDFVKLMIHENLLDAISVDIKHAPGKYKMLMEEKFANLEEKVWQTVDVVKKFNGQVFYRTTIVRGIHTIKDLKEIAEVIKPEKLILQNVQREGVGSEYLEKVNPFSQDEFEQFRGNLIN